MLGSAPGRPAAQLQFPPQPELGGSLPGKKPAGTGASHPADLSRHAQCTFWNPALPGAGSDLRVFTAAEGALRRGGWETVSALFGDPSLTLAAAARTARCRPIRARGRGRGRHALPLGLLRVISRNSVQREEREEREKERGQRRRERGRACETGRSAWSL